MADFKTRFKDLIGFGGTESVARDTNAYVEESNDDIYDEVQADEIENYDDESDEDISFSSDYSSYAAYASANASSGSRTKTNRSYSSASSESMFVDPLSNRTSSVSFLLSQMALLSASIVHLQPL